ncbi:MAG: hypothetical protein EBQ92_02600 [Proteobacteria bacterium]|nr:hypothetical protein [Pseudomonadota bacterium]
MIFRKASFALTLGLALVSTKALPEAEASPELVISKPYRTFVTIKKYNLENNGIPSKPISNVKLEISFPGGHKVSLPEGGHYWSIGNNQSQDINRTFEVPFAFIQKDGFSFDLTMVRKGKKILPCHFEVSRLSQFNRSYVCRTDVAFQMNQQNLPEEKVAKEAIEIRVFSDVNSTPAEIPKDAIALK